MSAQNEINIQILTGEPVSAGHVAIVIYNCPTVMLRREDGELVPVPGVQLTARKAMEIGMNLIHIAKLAEEFQNA